MPLEPRIIYEDSYVYVLDKPPGIHSVQQAKSSEFSVAEWLTEESANQSSVGKNKGDAGLVQRLDFETSGLIIAAKTNDCWEVLHQQILNSELEKLYFCLVDGIPQQKSISVEGFIGSPYRRASKVRVYKKRPGKPHRTLPALTEYQVIETNKKKNHSLLQVSAKSARRHQIRAQAASIGHPLVGDTLYGSTTKIGSNYPVSFYLQASYIKFRHPMTGKELEFKLEIPQEIMKLF